MVTRTVGFLVLVLLAVVMLIAHAASALGFNVDGDRA